jgi:hypothetical protein
MFSRSDLVMISLDAKIWSPKILSEYIIPLSC